MLEAYMTSQTQWITFN